MSESSQSSEGGKIFFTCLALGILVDVLVIGAWWTGEYQGRLSIISLMIYPAIFIGIGSWLESQLKKRKKN